MEENGEEYRAVTYGRGISVEGIKDGSVRGYRSALSKETLSLFSQCDLVRGKECQRCKKVIESIKDGPGRGYRSTL